MHQDPVPCDLSFCNARIVTADEDFIGSLRVRDGQIIAIDHGAAPIPGALDLQGDLLLPGLVELHTDNLERHITPRPKVRWHAGMAVQAHDAQMAAAGITTVYDAISCGDMHAQSVRNVSLDDMINAVTEARRNGWLRADHRLHLRCEVSTGDVLEIVERFVDNPLVGVMSVMDHAPGQRQFVHIDKYRTYYMGKYGYSDAEMDAFTERQLTKAALNSVPNRKAIAAICQERAITLASHDDATIEHVEEAVSLGTRFAEFPTTAVAARASRQGGMTVMMGAPNLVRGGSHSGNIAAHELAASGDLDILSSDYVPMSMLAGAMLLHKGPLGFTLADAINTVTRNPARTVGLDDRGEITIGKRADLVRITDTPDMPVVRSVWREGQRVV